MKRTKLGRKSNFMAVQGWTKWTELVIDKIYKIGRKISKPSTGFCVVSVMHGMYESSSD